MSYSYVTHPRLWKFADFGESLDCRADELEGFMMPFHVRGTSRGGCPAYLAPEVIAANSGRGKSIDFSKNDIFGLGMVAHHMLTGNLVAPFRVGSSQDYAKENYNELPPDACTKRVRDLVWGMIDPNKEARMDASQAHDTIAAYLG